jgi:hypothetical protein
LVGGSGGTYLAPTLRNARGRVFPGVLLSFGGSSAANSIRQRLPPLTQALEGGPVGITATLAQTLARLTQAAAGTVATTTQRSVRVTYLVLEVPDPALTGVVTQALPVLTQALDGTNSPDDRNGQIAQTLAALTQAAEAIVGAGNLASISQRLAALTQAATGTISAPVYPQQTVPRARVWQAPLKQRTWKA